MCERIRYITVTKHKDGGLGYSSSGMLSDEDVLKAMGIDWRRYLDKAFKHIKQYFDDQTAQVPQPPKDNP
jgi:hypothetical protein